MSSSLKGDSIGLFESELEVDHASTKEEEMDKVLDDDSIYETRREKRSKVVETDNLWRRNKAGSIMINASSLGLGSDVGLYNTANLKELPF